MNQNKTMAVKCLGCKEPIHPKRLEIMPNTQHCVQCSDTGRKRGVTIQQGEGDHSYTDVIIMEEKQFIQYMHLESKNSIKSSKPELLDSGDDDHQINGLNRINGDII